MSLFHRHKWTDWLVTEQGDMTFATKLVGKYLVQQRYCTACGKVKVSEYASHGGYGLSWCTRIPRAVKSAPRKDGVHA